MNTRITLIEQMRKDRYTFRAIGEKLGISKQRVFQIYKKQIGDNSKTAQKNRLKPKQK